MGLFTDREKSESAANPKELYSFNAGLQFWRYTTASREQIYESATYTRLEGLRREDFEGTREFNAKRLRVTVPFDCEVAKRYITIVPPLSTWLTIYRYHGDAASDVYVYWQGRIRSVEWVDDLTEAEMELEPMDTVLRRMGLWRLYQNPCNNQLYDSRCAVSLADNKAGGSVVVTGTTTFQLAAAALKANNWYTAGFAERSLDGDLRMITAHTSDSITTLTGFPNLQNGETIYIYSGCDHSWSGTNGCPKFNNQVNYGGFPHVPKKNIFETGLQ